MKQTRICTLALLAGLLSFCSCGKDERGAGQPGETGQKVSLEIPIEVLGMEQVDGVKATRLAKDADESKIYSLYVVQFNGTSPSSKVVAQGAVSRDSENKVSFAAFSAVNNNGTPGRVYVIANFTPSVTTGSTTLEAFEMMTAPYLPTTSVPLSGLPMCGYADFDPGSVTTAPTITLTAMVAKLVVKYTVADANLFKEGATVAIKLRNAASGTAFGTPTDYNVANNPTGLTYVADIMVGNTGETYTYYVPENISGANSAVSTWKERSVKNIPTGTHPLYFEIMGRTKDDKKTVTIASFIGDTSKPTEFNVRRNTVYTVTATINNLDTVDERILVYTNLSYKDDGITPATANCYIVTGANTAYAFDATKRGNGAENPSDPCFATINYSTLPDLFTAKSARVLWQTDGTSSVIKGDILLYDGKVLFTTGAASQGNAVIGLFDGYNGTGTCLWSWHIWKLSSAPGTVDCVKTPYPATASANFKMMDRNLGAYNNTPGDVGSIGFMYQWGRKDPFPGSGAWSDTEPNNIYGTYINASDGTGIWSGPYTIQTVGTSAIYGTEAWAVKHPTVFIKSNSDDMTDWYNGGAGNACLWGTPWQATGSVNPYNGRQGKKSIYDPCPIGYRVPPQDTWDKAACTSFADNGIFLKDMVPTGTFWFPAAGIRNRTSEAFGSVSQSGHYWSSSSAGNNIIYTGYFNFTKSESVYPSIRGSRSFGFSVRCVSESVSE